MAHLEPSVELTGGPWYTDNELDTEFIKLLCGACLRYIRERVCHHLLCFYLADPFVYRRCQNTSMTMAVCPRHSLCIQHRLVLLTRTPRKFFPS